MAMVKVIGQVVHPVSHSAEEEPVKTGWVIYRNKRTSVTGKALVAKERDIERPITNGVVEPAYLIEGEWTVDVQPTDGALSFTFTMNVMLDTAQWDGQTPYIDLKDHVPMKGAKNINYTKGDSAYQVAWNEGFRGSPKEWLATLKGDYEDIRNAVNAHRMDLAPHPVYDSTPDLVTLFENGLY